MLKTLLTGIVTLGILGCGATVGLEAVGLLFQPGALDPEQRTEAFVARLEAEISPVDLPTERVPLDLQIETVDIPGQVAQEPPSQGPGRLVAADAEPLGGDALAEAGPEDQADGVGTGEQTAVALTMKVQGPIAEDSPPPETEPALTPPAPSPVQMPEPVVDQVPEPIAAPPPVELAVQKATETPARASPRGVAGTGRAKSSRARTGSTGTFGCPVLDWMVL
jgi:hypothetical protein